MKYLSFNNIVVTLLCVIFVSLASCTKDFEEINTNPNNPEVVPNSTLLLSGITRGIDRIQGANMNMTYGGLWAQHYAKIQYIDEDKYSYRDAAMEAHWTGLYAGPLADLQDILDKGADNEVNMKAAALVMKCYIMSVMTDMWGDIPYSQALAVNTTAQPAYDSQASIYTDLVAQLGNAAAAFDAGADNIATGDALYGGDIASWEKLANSLRARLLNRMSAKDASAASTLSGMFNNSSEFPMFEGNTDNAALSFPGGSYANPLFENKYKDGRNDHAVSKTLVDLMNAINDPRLPIYAVTNNADAYVGQPNGSVEPASLSDVSPIGEHFRDNETGALNFMTYPELLFVKAEATNDKQAYLDAITASMSMFGVTADDDYMTAAGDFYDADPLKAVITHKWVALFGDGCEAFTEYRRTGFPDTIEEAELSVYPGQGVPKRYVYPPIEASTNIANLNAAKTGQSIDVTGLFGNKMWWAQ